MTSAPQPPDKTSADAPHALEPGADIADRAGKGLAVLTKVAATLPGTPGVYRMRNTHGDALYVG